MWQVKGDLTLTISIFAARIVLSAFLSRRALASTIAFQCSSIISSFVTLPKRRSSNFSCFNSASSLLIVMYSSVQQSSALMITSCDESHNLLVRYPDSAVLRAVSALPLRAPCAAIKYSIGENHSTNDD